MHVQMPEAVNDSSLGLDLGSKKHELYLCKDISNNMPDLLGSILFFPSEMRWILSKCRNEYRTPITAGKGQHLQHSPEGKELVQGTQYTAQSRLPNCRRLVKKQAPGDCKSSLGVRYVLLLLHSGLSSIIRYGCVLLAFTKSKIKESSRRHKRLCGVDVVEHLSTELANAGG